MQELGEFYPYFLVLLYIIELTLELHYSGLSTDVEAAGVKLGLEGGAGEWTI